MALFKSKENEALNRRVAELESEVRAKTNQVDYLVRTIRAMDDLIFSMSQCDNWPSMREKFVVLKDGMTARKVIESDRIGQLVEGELRKTYDPTGDNTKRLENMRGK